MKAATHMVAGLSLITAAIVHWDTVYLDRAGRCLAFTGGRRYNPPLQQAPGRAPDLARGRQTGMPCRHNLDQGQ
jgi:hypothetical protein